MTKAKQKKEPFLHVTRKMNVKFSENATWRILSVIIALLIASLIVLSFSNGKHIGNFFASLFSGTFGTERRFWITIRDTALLLGVSLALVPAFKMKFWNLGGNGQILIGCIVSSMVLYYLGGKAPDVVCWLLMIVASMVGGAVWGVIPAIFKAFFKTNESLFTLMMNYIAICLAGAIIMFWYPKSTGVMSPLTEGIFPTFGGSQFGKTLFPLIIVIIMTVFTYFYLNFTKHGYELEVVGESENTAKYIGVNVKKIVIRTMILSGAMCGLIGALLSGGVNYCVSSTMDNNMGFTGIMVAWLSNFNPIFMIVNSFFITFITKGMAQVNTDFGFSSESLSSVVIGIVYFLVIASAFFVNYKVTFIPVIQDKIDFVSDKLKAAGDFMDEKVFDPVKKFFNKIIVKPLNKIFKKNKEAK